MTTITIPVPIDNLPVAQAIDGNENIPISQNGKTVRAKASALRNAAVVWKGTSAVQEDTQTISRENDFISLSETDAVNYLNFPVRDGNYNFPKILHVHDIPGGVTHPSTLVLRIPVASTNPGTPMWTDAFYLDDPVTTGSTVVVSGITYREVFLPKGYSYFVSFFGTTSLAFNVFSGSGSSTPSVPNAPVANNATGVTESGFTANWGGVPGATSYKLEVSDDDFATLVADYDPEVNTGTSSVVAGAGIVASTLYKYRLKASNTSGDSVYSNIISVTTSAPSVADTLNRPFAADAINVASTSFRANWSTPDATASFLVRIATDVAFSSILSGYNDVEVTDLFLDVSGLTAGTRYYYDVRSKTSGGGLSPRSVPTTVLTSQATIPNQSDLEVFLDFTDASTVTLSSGKLASITDKAGSQTFTAQSDASSTVNYVTDAINGKPVASFTSGNRERIKGVCVVDNINSTFIIVAKLNEGGGITDYPILWESATALGVNTHAALLLYPNGVPAARKLQNGSTFIDVRNTNNDSTPPAANGQIKLNKYHVYVCRYSTNLTELIIDNVLIASSADSISSVTSADFAVGANIANTSPSYSSDFKVAMAMVFNKSLNNTELTNVYNYIANQLDLSKKNVAGNLQYEGDSLTLYGQDNVPGATTNYPTQLNSKLKSLLPNAADATTGNHAVAGQTISYNPSSVGNMNSNVTTTIDALVTSSKYLKVELCFLGGINDLFYGRTATEVYNDIVAYCTARQAVGIEICVATIPSRANTGTPSDFQTKADAVNTLLRANYTTFSNFGLADLAGDPRFQNPLDTRYFNGDKVHWTGELAGIAAGIYYKALTKQNL